MALSMKLFPPSEDTPKIMSLQLLEEITDNFSNKLGSGTYGEVYKGVHNGEEVAVKKLHLTPKVDDFEQQFKKEFENLWRLKHQNIVRLLGYCYETKREAVELLGGKLILAEHIFRYLCFDYMHNGSLTNHLHDEYHGLDWQTRYKIIKGTCQGLKYLHEELKPHMYHLDLKPGNILLDENMVPKLADFGLSKLVHSDETQVTNSQIGTWGYTPPEYIDGGFLSKKWDIFSLGVVLIKIMTGKDGYQKKAEMSSQEFIDLVHNNWRNRLQTTPGCHPENKCHQVRRCIEIALACVKADRKQRPHIGAIVHLLDETEETTEQLIMCSYQKMGHNTVQHVDTKLKKQFTKDDCSETSNTCSHPLIHPLGGLVYSQGTEYNLKFYMHQTIDGPGHNQVNIADPMQRMMFGYTNVHDYPIYDSLGPNAEIVARAQGLHTETNMNCDDWFHWSSIVFTNERYQGSSFKAIGNQDKVRGQWAIVGGTGVFTLAQGSISIHRIIQYSGSSNVKEICIRSFCRTPQTSPRQSMAMHSNARLRVVDSKATSNVLDPSMANPQSDPVTPQSLGVDYNLKFYMHQSIEGPNRNQVNIADPRQPMMFGYTNVHDYPIYDSLGPNAKVVARAQGLHTVISMNSDDWFHWSSIVFSDERFPGSSLKAIGNQDKLQGEWAIIGGTGRLSFAQGIVYINRIQQNGASNIKEINIHVFCGAPHDIQTEIKHVNDGMIQNHSIGTSYVRNPSTANSHSGLVRPQLQGINFNNFFYMYQTIEGLNHNQINIADPKQPMMFGYTNVHDYPIYDSLGPSAKIVARAQGLHTETSMNQDDWFHWSSMVFCDERFQGSTFIAIGNQDKLQGEWAIVGGTGVFTFAQGRISIYRIQDNGPSNIKEVHISVFCRTP